jgi:hypothetical protein
MFSASLSGVINGGGSASATATYYYEQSATFAMV